MIRRSCLPSLAFVLYLLGPVLSANETIDLSPGTAPEQFALALRYLGGDGLRQSDREGIRWLKRAANAGYAPAQNHLAICQRTGTGFLFKNRRQAERWFLTAAEAGYLPAMLNLANAYLEDDAKGGMKAALPWLERAARFPLDDTVPPEDFDLFSEVKGSANARLGQFYLDRDEPGDAANAFQHLQTAADLGNLDGQLKVARCFALGLGTPSDLDQANRHLDNAGRNVASRMRRMGDHFYTVSAISAREAYAIEEEATRESQRLVRELRVAIANEMAEDEASVTEPAGALRWFEQAAEAGSDFAAARVAQLWLRDDARGDLDEAAILGLLERAAERKVLIAHQALGYYWAEIARPADPVKARQSYEEGRAKGHYAAHLALEGDRSILPMTLPESMKLARRDAPPDGLSPEATLDARQLHALFATGIAAWHGIGEPLNRGLAARRFQEAARRGHPEAAFYTGLAYLQGHLQKFALFDPQASLKEAYALLQRGASRGSQDALYMLGIFDLNGVAQPRPNPAGARRHFEQLSASGDVARGDYGLGLVAMREGKSGHARALEAFETSAEAGDVDSMIYVAFLLADAETDLPRDLPRARAWAEKAIATAENDGRGYFFLGRVLEAADPPARDEAYIEYERAAIRGHRGGLEKVARAYADGDPLPYNPRVAARFFRTLVQQRPEPYLDDLLQSVFATGDENDLRNLLDELRSANLSSRKSRLYRAFLDYETAQSREDRQRLRGQILNEAGKGDADAQLWVLQRFHGTSRPTGTMQKLARELTAEANPDAYYFLALAARQSDRWKVEEDPEEMILRAAAAGSLRALEDLLALHRAGHPLAPSREDLKAWLEPLAERGIEEAVELLESLLEEELPAESQERKPDPASGLGEALA
jgi:TPR repeat protein